MYYFITLIFFIFILRNSKPGHWHTLPFVSNWIRCFIVTVFGINQTDYPGSLNCLLFFFVFSIIVNAMSMSCVKRHVCVVREVALVRFERRAFRRVSLYLRPVRAKNSNIKFMFDTDLRNWILHQKVRRKSNQCSNVGWRKPKRGKYLFECVPCTWHLAHNA